jgi:ribonuclease P protein component
LGIIVSKKFGGAVARNRFKRIVRAALRALSPEMSAGWDLLVLPREAHSATMPEVLASFRQLLGALGLLQSCADNSQAVQ